MPRIARGLADGLIYHVLNRGNGKQTIFHKDQDYRTFVELMKEAKKKYEIKIFAYCLMPNHFHIVMMPIRAGELSKYMQWLMTSHVRRYHRHYETSGHVWQGRFKSFIIQEDNHLLTVLRYVERNPLRKGLVKSAKQWTWSSHRESINEKPVLLIDKIPIELPDDWSRYVDMSPTNEEVAEISKCVNRGCPYGAPVWQLQVSKELGLESTLKPRGRPKSIIEKGEK
ncbi:MAG: transposase [Candidatus Omnitrophica bacterium]|nr:transposase [Candidatus Omnitrophota bacterium]MBU4488286.1 transposase [Candidatus Omnitrophota bacterium]MCG2704498.1 transposase [Candidatus Omnitrophota bacterium]